MMGPGRPVRFGRPRPRVEPVRIQLDEFLDGATTKHEQQDHDADGLRCRHVAVNIIQDASDVGGRRRLKRAQGQHGTDCQCLQFIHLYLSSAIPFPAQAIRPGSTVKITETIHQTGSKGLKSLLHSRNSFVFRRIWGFQGGPYH